MHQKPSNPSGPLVLLGASYAKGWVIDGLNGIPVVNAGVSGQQSFEMLERFERDVVAVRPRAVILWGFINDIFRARDIDASLQRVRDSYTAMVARARAAGIEPILATEVTVRAPDSWTETILSFIGGLMGKESYQDQINRNVLAINGWLSELAAREQLLLIDLHGALADEDGRRRRREFIDADGTHITREGYDALTRYAAPILYEHLTQRMSPKTQ
jgi:lysophospholipase L1-like esterase